MRDVTSLCVEMSLEGKSSMSDVTVFCHGIRRQEMINMDVLSFAQVITLATDTKLSRKMRIKCLMIRV